MTRNAIARGPHFTADMVVFDRDDAPVLLAEIKNGPTVPETVNQLVSYLQATDPETPFGLLADPRQLRFFRADSTTPALTLATEDVVSRYDSDYQAEQVSAMYVGTLLEAWLDDLRAHWDSDSPPASDAIQTLGLLPLLADGSIKREVRFATYRVR